LQKIGARLGELFSPNRMHPTKEKRLLIDKLNPQDEQS
jgi:hypothetical protein